MLSPEMLDLLRQWWKVRLSRYDGETPLQERWLFPGSKGRRARQADNHTSPEPIIP
jgi:integrase